VSSESLHVSILQGKKRGGHTVETIHDLKGLVGAFQMKMGEIDVLCHWLTG
jgi:hypothetical protein